MDIGNSLNIDGDVSASGRLRGGDRHPRLGTRFSWVPTA